MARFSRHFTALSGVMVAERLPLQDHRGYFERLFCDQEFSDFLAGDRLAQINRSVTRRTGSIRGMHLQTGVHGEKKIVTCLNGKVFDVAVDLRPDSKTYGRWVSVELSQGSHLSLLIPEGVAHGFQTLTDDCELLYFHTCHYAPEAETGVNALDESLAIHWPLKVTELSERDRNLPGLNRLQGATR